MVDSKVENARIGVFVCHCGTNISQMVDIEEVVAYASGLPGVALATQHKYMCSDPGQDEIKKSITTHGLTRVVVSSCSPLMHEKTFQGAVEDAGLNRFFFQMANIREQVSWVTTDRKAATEKAKKLIRAAVMRVVKHNPLELKTVPVNPDVLIVGAGIAGIEASLQIADAGYKVNLVERDATIGGHMAQFDKTFPTLDCSACILTPKMVSVGQHKNINLMTYAEVVEVSGHVGDFKVKVKKKARYVDDNICNGCGACWEHCPSIITPKKRTMKIGKQIINSNNR
jgi:heterodisulfide reductase subunit A2